MENLELKCLYKDLKKAEEICLKLNAAFIGKFYQKDTFFNVPRGRLKLREVENRSAELIWYERTDEPGVRKSDYYIFETTDAVRLSLVLERGIDIKGIVEKERTVYIFHNVRIHLDQVKNLGTFLEFEAVITKDSERDESLKRLDFLMEEFGIQKEDIIPEAYIDLLE